MKLMAIIPVKPLADGKSRLAAVMSDAERRDFNRRSLVRTLDVAIAALGKAAVLVVSEDAAVLDLARARGVAALAEPHGAGLNAALEQAATEASGRSAGAVLVLPVDLPMLEPGDIEAMAAPLGDAQRAVIAPDLRGEGTNALLLAPPGLVGFAFGPGSFAAHCAALRAAGVEPAIVRRDALAFDIDTPGDHARMRETTP